MHRPKINNKHSQTNDNYTRLNHNNTHGQPTIRRPNNNLQSQTITITHGKPKTIHTFNQQKTHGQPQIIHTANQQQYARQPKYYTQPNNNNTHIHPTTINTTNHQKTHGQPTTAHTGSQ